ncbi:hypothetical protein TGAM01_v208873 [Trichoderma gamsii]|uniref:F-box domain-containing protein n=1 Tax=Trichoderma gamsii TaxID=398673 RepID=A0A2P4ZD29_9HYPO|nr:hypothetical protein TGAM01_v208873 [Trichoderma gamsii]PON22192.1 hypothetical protein TGAM01_v208873 [Trichoderma gamsii]
MGSWDSYCAICGGPFDRLTVAQKPRSERFLRRHGLSQSQSSSSAQANHSTEDGNEDTTAETSDDEAAGEAPLGTMTQEDAREDGSYDCDVVTSREVAWVRDLHILMTNENLDTGERVACVSGVGEFHDNTQASVDDGDDPNWDPEAEIVLYDGSFPFHWPCYEILGTVLEGKAGIAGLNKLNLYNTMLHASGVCCSRLESLDYGDPGPHNEQWWAYEPGTEFLVVHPTISLEKTTALIRERWMRSTQVVSPSDRVRRISADSFQKLPLELLLKTCNMLGPQSLYQLALASPTVDALLGDKPFWGQYLSIHMPWSYELLSLLDDESQTSFQNADFKSLVRWVDQESTPRHWMRGPFMSIANRRRIWHVCEQLKPVYSGRDARFPLTVFQKRRVNLRRARMGMPLLP